MAEAAELDAPVPDGPAGIVSGAGAMLASALS